MNVLLNSRNFHSLREIQFVASATDWTSFVFKHVCFVHIKSSLGFFFTFLQSDLNVQSYQMLQD